MEISLFLFYAQFFFLSEEVYGCGVRGQEVSLLEGGRRMPRTGMGGGGRLAAWRNQSSSLVENPTKKKKTKEENINGSGFSSIDYKTKPRMAK